MTSSYGDLNMAQSVSTGPHGALLRLVSRIAMLTIEVPAAMKAGDWPEQRRIRGDLDEAISRLADIEDAPPPARPAISELIAVGRQSVRAAVATPRGTPEALASAHSAAAAAEAAVEAIRTHIES